MPTELLSFTCQRCSRGFVLTSLYLDLLTRRGVRVVEPALCPTCFLDRGPLPKEQGRVKWFDPRRRYGFIVTDQGSDIFFHQDQLVGQHGPGPEEGQRAQFHVRYAVKGPTALNVELMSEQTQGQLRDSEHADS